MIVPQWQGSASSRALRLIDGAEAIRGDLPASATRVVEVPMEAGESLDTGVLRFSSLVQVRERTVDLLRATAGPVITIGGDCGVELAAVGHAVERAGGDVALVWLDAHPDLHTPQTSPSGAFTGMVLRAILGEGSGQLTGRPDTAPQAGHVILAGLRSVDDAEDAFIAAAGIRTLAVGQLSDPAALLDAIEATGAGSVYLHVDLDVLDPGVIDGLGDPQPFGLQADILCLLIKSVRSRFELAGAGLTEFAPESPEAATQDLPVILRILGALTAPVG